MIVKQANSATKHDSGKPRLDLLPVEPLLQIAKVLAFGAQKYGDHNWRSQTDGGFVWGRLYAATLRHLFAFWNGEDLDAESGLPHLAHAACNIIFLLEFMNNGGGVDDRVKKGAV
ncbi:dATP/dGTP diphosphohydrolase domain-containing protein [Bartonella sp. HY761]|uniref:dATP/dGTP diphosphohydrolase domain-containing protein n=1 Tax=Bartonella sp. HY761 TaxID=2979330 RepID=UPI00220BC313|nr:dATP/dGTP diphosphohydrolase domain-containing protein [Bartonella sp. HY761]UXN05240.1 DUF5664 domain-containing protein [Bartonella sp. HY761]